MEIILGIIVGVIVLTIIVVFHELGHALVAKKYGTVVEELGVGFPPRATSKKIKKSLLGKNVEYSLNWLPLGGFVKLQGEHDDDRGKGDYGAMTFWQKSLTLLAGVIINWILAAVLFTVLLWTGLPKMLPNQFSIASDTKTINSPVQLVTVESNLPAAHAGLKSGDKIITLNGKAIKTPEDLTTFAKENKGKSIPVTYERDGTTKLTTVAIRSENTDKKGYLGVAPAQQQLLKATWSAPIAGVGTTIQLTGETFKGLGQMVSNLASGLVMKLSPDQTTRHQADENLDEAGASVAGPVAIFGVIFPSAQKQGPTYVVAIAAIISLSLAVMNVLPIPGLDGGRWFVMALYKIRRKTLTKEKEEKIQGIGMAVLIALVVVITITDIGKF